MHFCQPCHLVEIVYKCESCDLSCVKGFPGRSYLIRELFLHLPMHVLLLSSP
uniref:Uncharacterized protein n=1 Tax=Rhizophora mucronata TaxID=61149 RepID=A0A2P2PA34_RHIMU